MFSLTLGGKELEKEVAFEYSHLMHVPQSETNLSICTHGRYIRDHSKAGIGLHWKPSSNLVISGLIEPALLEEDAHLYLNMALGYIPDWDGFLGHSPVIEFGMHRLRFADIGEYRWFHFRIGQEIETRVGAVQLGLIRLFDANWNHYQLQSQFTRELNKSIALQIGCISQNIQSSVIQPYLAVNVKL